MTLYPHKDMTHIIKINFDIIHLRITNLKNQLNPLKISHDLILMRFLLILFMR